METITISTPNIIVANTGHRDPSRTTGIRNGFVRDMDRRFRELTKLITRAIVTEDVFALRGSDVIITQQTTPGFRRFNFPRSSQKISAFMEWLNREIAAGILDIRTIGQVGESINAAWTNQYVYNSYRRGVERARIQLRQAGYNIPTVEQSGGITSILSAPIHIERVGILFTRTFNDLKGITNAMDASISRVLAQGMADGIHPRAMARQLVSVVRGGGGDLGITDTLGRYIPAARRARVLARTETIRAHAEAQLQEYKNWGVLGVNIMAEWMTAGDQRVCARCQANEGHRFTIEQARNMIPLHPQCRCAWVPISVDKRGRRINRPFATR